MATAKKIIVEAPVKKIKIEKEATLNTNKKTSLNKVENEVNNVDSGSKKDWDRVWKDSSSVQVKFNFLR